MESDRDVDVDEDSDDSFVKMSRKPNRKGQAEATKSKRRRGITAQTDRDEADERAQILKEVVSSSGTRSSRGTPKSDAETTSKALKAAMARTKNLVANAFQDRSIDRLSKVVQKEPLVQAGAMLDASARIYSFRVDVTHSEACEVRLTLNEATDPNTKATGKGRKKEEPPKKDESGSEEDKSDDVDGENRKTEGTEGRRKKQREEQKALDFEDSGGEEDGAGKGKALNEMYPELEFEDLLKKDDNEHSDLDDVITPESLIKKFSAGRDAVRVKNAARRKKQPMLTTDHELLDDHDETALEVVDPLYSYATRNCDEGASCGLLMQNAIYDKHGHRFMLHRGAPPSGTTHNALPEYSELLNLYSFMEDTEKEENVLHWHAFALEPEEERAAPSSCSTTPPMATEAQQEYVEGDDFAELEPLEFPPPMGAEKVKNLEGAFGTRELMCPWTEKERAVFLVRRNVQKKFRLTVSEFFEIKRLRSTIMRMPSEQRNTFVERTRPPSPKGSALEDWAAIIEGGGAELERARILDELQGFEVTLDWVLTKVKWDDMSDAERAMEIMLEGSEDKAFNYFVARDVVSPYCREAHRVQKFASALWTNEEVPSKQTTDANDLEQLTAILETYKFDERKAGVFLADDVEEVNAVVASVIISTPKAKRSSELMRTAGLSAAAIADRREEEDFFLEDFPSMSDDRSRNPFDGNTNMEAAAPREIKNEKEVNGFDKDVNSEMDVKIEMNPGDPGTAGGDVTFAAPEAIHAPSVIVANDDAHWAARPDAAQVKVEPSKDPKEKKKTKKDKISRADAAKSVFEWNDDDQLPLASFTELIGAKSRNCFMLPGDEELLARRLDVPVLQCINVSDVVGNFENMVKLDWSLLRVDGDRTSNTDVRVKVESEASMEAESVLGFCNLFNGLLDFSVSPRGNGTAEAAPTTDDTPNRSYDEPIEDGPDDSMGEISNGAVNIAPQVVAGPLSQEDDASDVEEAQIFGLRYSIKQKRVNAPALKKAFCTILEHKELDSTALERELKIASAICSAGDDGAGESQSSSGAVDGAPSSDASPNRSGPSRETVDPNENNRKGDYGATVSEQGDTAEGDAPFSLDGNHTFESLLTHLPMFFGEEEEVDVAGAFSVFLHVCNENALDLVQQCDEEGMVLPTEVDKFTVVPARRSSKGPKSSKRTK